MVISSSVSQVRLSLGGRRATLIMCKPT
jgi:hypothetical protein